MQSQLVDEFFAASQHEVLLSCSPKPVIHHRIDLTVFESSLHFYTTRIL